MNPRMFYFGPWDQPGHYLFTERRTKVWGDESDAEGFPWRSGYGIDGVLQPGCHKDRDGRWTHRGSPEVEGAAVLHHRAGWTAISFWDRSVDKRGACNSTYFAEGLFTFEQMVEMAKARFSERWNKMQFEVRWVGVGAESAV